MDRAGDPAARARCATAQGWLFARPAPWEEVARLLDAPLALCPTEGADRGRAAS